MGTKLTIRAVELAQPAEKPYEIRDTDISGLYFLMREALSIQLLREAYAKTDEIGFLCHVRADVVINYPQQFTVITGVRPAAD
jgi:hypothetical protein